MKLKIELSKNSLINERLIAALDVLLQTAPPSYLRKSLTEILLAYLSNTEPEDYKPEIKEICTDFYCLLKFLEEAENLIKKEN
jgi:hypothetical protein